MSDMECDPFPSTSRFQIPTSSSRDEPIVRPRPRGNSSPLAPAPPRSMLRPEYDKYNVTRRVEIVPGLQDDGRITVRHPLVELFLANAPAVAPAEGRKPPIEEWIKRGMKEKTVNDILNIGTRLTGYQCNCVFALAALKVLHHPNHPKHFTFWGRDPAQKTAERVQKVLDRSPCPIESPVGWIGIPENLWLVDGLQASLFPTKKEGKKVDNGMLLRKRKAHARSAPVAADSGEPPKKRTRTSKAAEKENAEMDATAQAAELPALALPQLDAIQPTDPEMDAEKPLDKVAKLELIGVESPFANTLVLDSSPVRPPTRATPAAPTETTRRSTRQANKKVSPGAASTASTPMTEIASLIGTPPPTSAAPGGVEEAQRPPLTRARSSSASSGSSTAVSEAGSAGDTAVEPDSAETESNAKTKAGGKRRRVEEDVDVEGDAEKAPVRTSARVRKPAKKALHVEEDASVVKKAVAATVAEGRKTRAKRS